MDPEKRSLLSLCGLPDDDESRRRIDSAVAAVPAALQTSSALLRLLVAAEPFGPDGHGGAGAVVAMCAERGNDIESIARTIDERFSSGPHPQHPFESVAKYMLDERVPALSDQAWIEMAAVGSAQCRINEGRQRVVDTLKSERQKGRRPWETSVWKSMVEASDRFPHDEFDGLRESLTRDELSELMSYCEEEASGADLMRGLGLLHRLLGDDDARFDAALRRRWALVLRVRVQARAGDEWSSVTSQRAWARIDRTFLNQETLRRYRATGKVDRSVPFFEMDRLEEGEVAATAAVLSEIVKGELARGRAPYEALMRWRQIAEEDATRFLTLELDVSKLGAPTLLGIARELVSIGTAAESQLRLVAERTDRAGDAASIGLEILGLAPQDRIEALAQTWRRARQSEILYELYHTYLELLPVGTPFAVWRRRLGVDGEPGQSFSVNAEGGSPTIFVELSSDDRLSGLSLS